MLYESKWLSGLWGGGNLADVAAWGSGMWCDRSLCCLLGPCRILSHTQSFIKEMFYSLSFKLTRTFFFTPSLCGSHQKYSCRFLVNVFVETLMRIVVSDGSSVLCSLGEPCWCRLYWLWWWPYDQMIIQGAVQYNVLCTISYSRKLEYCWRPSPLWGCPTSQCPDPGHVHLNQVVVSVMFFHLQILFSPMQYGMHPFCYLQIPVGFWFPLTFFHMDPLSFHTWQC